MIAQLKQRLYIRCFITNDARVKVSSDETTLKSNIYKHLGRLKLLQTHSKRRQRDKFPISTEVANRSNYFALQISLRKRPINYVARAERASEPFKDRQRAFDCSDIVREYYCATEGNRNSTVAAMK